MNGDIRVRFAPSPTGYLHVGSLRTALYNYLYTRKVGGKFILRIEDTDRTRFVEGSVENLLKTLKNVGLEYDEGPEKEGEYGPYFQSERTELYKKYADELINKSVAYHCFCTKEKLDKMREKQIANKEDPKYDGSCRKLTESEIQKKIEKGESYVIRLKIPLEGEITFYDLLREKVTFPWNMVDDQVLMKSDGYPTYHLANVVDDHLMKITHVIRGEEWLSSVPKHLYLYRVFNWKPPKMLHLPLLLNPDKSKLSKRQGDVAVEDFLNKGYLPETLINFVALLGWHPKGDRELFTLTELVKEFSLKRINKAGAVFDIEKLNWMNGHYIRHLKLDYIANKSRTYFEQAGLDISDDKKYKKIITFARERVSHLDDIIRQSMMFFEDLEFSEEDKSLFSQEASQKIFLYWIRELNNKNEWNDEEINNLVKKSSEELGIKGKDFYFPLRLALFGSSHGPDISTIIGILGKNTTVSRLKNCINPE